MRSYRGILTILVLVALLVSAAVAAIRLLYPPLPHPAEANRDELVRWLVVRDLSVEPLEIRGVLATRLEKEFGTGLDWEAMGRRLDRTQQRQVWNNFLLLLEPWFTTKTNRYFELAVDDRPAYLDQLLDTIDDWRGADVLRPEPSEESESAGQQSGLLQVFFARVEQWKGQSDPQTSGQISQFAEAIQTRWLLRNLRQLWPAPQ